MAEKWTARYYTTDDSGNVTDKSKLYSPYMGNTASDVPDYNGDNAEKAYHVGTSTIGLTGPGSQVSVYGAIPEMYGNKEDVHKRLEDYTKGSDSYKTIGKGLFPTDTGNAMLTYKQLPGSLQQYLEYALKDKGTFSRLVNDYRVSHTKKQADYNAKVGSPEKNLSGLYFNPTQTDPESLQQQLMLYAAMLRTRQNIYRHSNKGNRLLLTLGAVPEDSVITSTKQRDYPQELVVRSFTPQFSYDSNELFKAPDAAFAKNGMMHYAGDNYMTRPMTPEQEDAARDILGNFYSKYNFHIDDGQNLSDVTKKYIYDDLSNAIQYKQLTDTIKDASRY